MEKQPLVSVIVPIYKVADFLDRCIKSIVNQTYTNLEIILVDDESPDSSPLICDKWAERDSRIKVIHKQNEGVAIARNTALDIAKGEYIGFVDGDDYCFKNMYEHLVKNALEKDADISMCSYYESDTEIDDYENTTSLVRCVNSVDIMSEICVGDMIYGVLWNKIYKTSVVKDIRMPKLVCSQDLPYNYFAFKKADKIAISDEKHYFYRVRETSTTKSKFGYGAFDAIKARQIILNGEADTDNLSYALKGYIYSMLVVLRGIIINQKCLDRYDELRNEILKYKSDIIFSKSLYSFKDKLKVIILKISPKIYNYILRKLG